MSVFTVKSKVIANRDSTPPLLSNPEVAQGVLKAVFGAENTGNFGTDLGAAGTAIKLVTVPSNARLQTLEYSHGDLGTSTLDIAVFYPTAIPQGGQNTPASSLAGTCAGTTVFVSNLQGVDTSLGWTNGLGVAATPTLQNTMKPLWSLIGLTTDPGLDFDLGFSIRVAVVQNGYVGLRATYVD